MPPLRDEKKKFDPKSELIWLLVAVIGYVPIGLMVAFIRMRIWMWFIVPYLQAPALTVLEMWGIGIFINCFKSIPQTDKPNGERIANIVVETIGIWAAYFMAMALHAYLNQ